MEKVIFQATDLSRERTRFLEAARNGRARVRDKDGMGLVMLPESELDVLEGFAEWSQRLNRLNALIEAGRTGSADLLGDLAWVRTLDLEDVRELAADLHQALVVGLADRTLDEVEQTVADWRITARQLEDPMRRSVLLGQDNMSEYTDAEEPTVGQ